MKVRTPSTVDRLVSYTLSTIRSERRRRTAKTSDSVGSEIFGTGPQRLKSECKLKTRSITLNPAKCRARIQASDGVGSSNIVRVIRSYLKSKTSGMIIVEGEGRKLFDTCTLANKVLQNN
jgi:hypothetical protein